jgi:Spy/CpxP family protein refolding chaperone
MRVALAALSLVVSLAMVGSLLAQEHKQKPEKPRPDRPMMGGQFDQFQFPRGLKPTDEQKAKLEELKKHYEPKVKELREKMENIWTDEQKKAREEAIKAAKEAGKSPREVQQAAREAVKLTDEQKAKFEECRKAMGELGKEIREKIMDLLTPEQKEQLKKMRENWQGGGGQGKRRGPQPRVD